MIGGALLRGGIMNGTLVHGRMKDEADAHHGFLCQQVRVWMPSRA